MRGAEARFLRDWIGRPVVAYLDDPEGEFRGTLVELRPSGPRVKFDTPHLRERTVAAWRISKVRS